MNTNKRFFLFIFVVFLISCRQSQHQEEALSRYKIVTVLAHPDDEVLIAGTLAKLNDKGHNVKVVYVTSGDDGHDVSGQNLYGQALGTEREKEAKKSISALGIDNPPVFLRFPDSYVKDHFTEMKDSLYLALKSLEPEIVIGFGPHGVTGDEDHIWTGIATDSIFSHIGSAGLLLHITLTEKAFKYFRNIYPTPKSDIDLNVRVTKYNKKRRCALNAHRTQFTAAFRNVWKFYVIDISHEHFIVARNKSENLINIKSILNDS